MEKILSSHMTDSIKKSGGKVYKRKKGGKVIKNNMSGQDLVNACYD